MPHRFDPAHRGQLDCAIGRGLNAARVLDLLPLKNGDTIADIGCGTGFFTIPLAQRLPEGKVFALDVAAKMLESLKKKIEKKGIKNITPVLTEEAEFHLPAESVNGVLLFCVLHETEDKVIFLQKVKDILKPGGWVALLEWEKKGGISTLMGPPQRERIAPEEAQEMFNKIGFKFLEKRAVGRYYYLLILEKG